MIVNANALHIPLANKTVQCAITSPPYWGLRDYGTATWIGGDESCDHKPRAQQRGTFDGGLPASSRDPLRGGDCKKCGAIREDAQLGLEKTPELYVSNMVSVFREVWRVLKDDGVLWLNLGDCYAHASSGGAVDVRTDGRKTTPGDKVRGRMAGMDTLTGSGLKPKDLVGIPWMIAFALRSDGWYLRQDIIWHKPNPMPESVTDRCTKSHEYIFLLSKNARYYYDHEAIKEEGVGTEYDKTKRKSGRMEGSRYLAEGTKQEKIGASLGSGTETRNKRSVWTVTTKPYKGAHFATFPPDLIEPMVLAGSREGDIIIDPFSGTSTVGQVAHKHKRQYFGTELSFDYIQLAKDRLSGVQVSLL